MDAFNTFPGSSRVWIYQSTRKLNTDEAEYIRKAGKEFLETWKSHGLPVKAALDVLHGYFVIITADESLSPAGGCSIDESVRFIKKISTALKTDMLDRTLIACRVNNQVQLFPHAEAEKLIRQNILNGDTMVFNNLIQTLDEFRSGWETPLRQTWLSRFPGEKAV